MMTPIWPCGVLFLPFSFICQAASQCTARSRFVFSFYFLTGRYNFPFDRNYSPPPKGHSITNDHRVYLEKGSRPRGGFHPGIPTLCYAVLICSLPPHCPHGPHGPYSLPLWSCESLHIELVFRSFRHRPSMDPHGIACKGARTKCTMKHTVICQQSKEDFLPSIQCVCVFGWNHTRKVWTNESWHGNCLVPKENNMRMRQGMRGGKERSSFVQIDFRFRYLYFCSNRFLHVVGMGQTAFPCFGSAGINSQPASAAMKLSRKHVRAGREMGTLGTYTPWKESVRRRIFCVLCTSCKNVPSSPIPDSHNPIPPRLCCNPSSNWGV